MSTSTLLVWAAMNIIVMTYRKVLRSQAAGTFNWNGFKQWFIPWFIRSGS